MGREAVEAPSADHGADLGVDISAPERAKAVGHLRLRGGKLLQKVTLGRSARSEALLVGGTARSVKKVKN